MPIKGHIKLKERDMFIVSFFHQFKQSLNIEASNKKSHK